jgi:hypothetical protein
VAGSYYTQANAKLLLDIASGDTADDSLLDLLGGVANQHIDNILKKHDEKIPNISTNVLEDIKLAADYYTASLYKGRREQPESAKYWLDQYQIIIDGIIEERSIDGETYIVERHATRHGGHFHQFADHF